MEAARPPSASVSKLVAWLRANPRHPCAEMLRIKLAGRSAGAQVPKQEPLDDAAPGPRSHPQPEAVAEAANSVPQPEAVADATPSTPQPEAVAEAANS
eukprot:7516897-Alexandrium_andersonii.AAC.1